MSILIILSGTIDQIYDESFFKNYNKIICCDGGYNNLLKLNINIIPDYIIGDFDSINNINILNNFPKEKIIKKDNQDVSDFQFAIDELIIKNKLYDKYNNLDVIYFTSLNRIDHLFANLIGIENYAKDLNIKFISKYQEIYAIKDKKFILKNKKNYTISLLPLTECININTNGLKWEIKNGNFKECFTGGISNIILQDKISIEMNKVCLLAIVSDLNKWGDNSNI